MKNIYEACGSFDVNKLTATANTFIPQVPKLVCKYVNYYNISNDNEYGIFGVMVDNQENTDLRTSEYKGKATEVGPIPIDFTTINSKYATSKLEDITIDDDLYFFCFHDNTFDESYLKNLMAANISLKELLTTLRNIPLLKNDYVIPEKLKLFIPKKGNGGILTADGSC